jgi:hypothetical protein
LKALFSRLIIPDETNDRNDRDDQRLIINAAARPAPIARIAEALRFSRESSASKDLPVSKIGRER